MIPHAFDAGFRDRARRVALGTAAACALALVPAGWRLASARAQVANLKLQASARQARLVEGRQAATSLPKAPAVDALDRSRAVYKLRTALTSLAASKCVTVGEFEVAPDETPYLTAYASDNKDPGWVQIAVRVALEGRSNATLATLAGLRGLDVPFEIDKVQLTRRATDNNGVATVGAEIAMRLLVYKGEG